MPQINAGYVYSDGMQVNATNLNALVSSATMGSQSITQQSAITDGIVATDDVIAIYDTSTTNLKKATIGNVLGSNLPVSTVAITGNNDITVTPADGTAVTLKAYASIDGITTTVTSTAHGLTTGQVVTISSASNVSYNGTYKITVTGVDTFTYLISSVIGALSGTGTSVNTTTTGTVTSNAHGLTTGMLIKIQVYNSTGVLISAYTSTSVSVTVTGLNTFTYLYTTTTASSGNSVVWQTLTPLPSTGTLTYQRKGVEKVVGSRITTGNNYTDGTVLANAINVTNSVIAGGSTTTNTLVVNGTTNHIGTVQKDGTNCLNLYSIVYDPWTTTAGSDGTTSMYYDQINYQKRILSYVALWSLVGGSTTGSSNAYNGGHIHYKETFVVPNKEQWFIEFGMTHSRGTDDAISTAWVKKVGTTYSELLTSGSQAPTTWIQNPSNFKIMLTEGTTEIIFKSAVIGGSGDDRIYTGDNSCGGRTVYKYKI